MNTTPTQPNYQKVDGSDAVVMEQDPVSANDVQARLDGNKALVAGWQTQIVAVQKEIDSDTELLASLAAIGVVPTVQ